MRQYLPGQAPKQREQTERLSGESVTFTVVTDVNFTTSKKKTRVVTVKNGKIENVSQESAWQS